MPWSAATDRGSPRLVKLLAGVEQADPGGTITVGSPGARRHPDDPGRGPALGLRFVHQDAGVFPDMSIAENLALGRAYETGLAGRVRWKRLTARARQELEVVGLDCDPADRWAAWARPGRPWSAIARALADLPRTPRKRC